MSDYLKRKRDLPLWRQLQDRCEHFNGLINAVCRAGVTYTDVRVGSTRPYAFPCLVSEVHQPATTTCERAKFLTDDEAKAREAEIRGHAEARAERERAGFCGQCGTKVERKAQVGRCIYNEPCGCRLGQGRLK